MSRLQRQLGLLDVFCIAAGAMISSGLFVLPAIAYERSGPAVIGCYLLASLLMFPSLVSTIELATAMPRAGGAYFYIDRSLGSIFGLFSGFATWFALALKSAFAVVGLAAFAQILLESQFGVAIGDLGLKFIGMGCCVFFAGLNLLSVKHASRFQVWLVIFLLGVLLIFIIAGAPPIDLDRYKGFGSKGWVNFLATTGFVFVSFGGLTKVSTIAEEVRRPGRNMFRGMMLAWVIVSLFYVATVAVAVGVTEPGDIVNTLAPLSTAAEHFMGSTGYLLLSLAAVTAFVTTANGGILAASRCPMAMSRDRLLPNKIAEINQRFNTPHVSIILTALFMIAAILFLDLETLVKTASTLLILVYLLAGASVIVMRESRIPTYRPKYKSPLYPYLHIASVIIYILLIIDMGWIPLGITAVFFVASAAWYFFYVSKRVQRESGIMHVVERMTNRELKTSQLESELRDILIERDEIIEDRFDGLVRNCPILDIIGNSTDSEVFDKVADILSPRLGRSQQELHTKFAERESQGGTVISPGIAVPHVIVEGTERFELMIIRAREGFDFPHAEEKIRIMFVLAGSKDQRNYHLRALMAIAQIIQQRSFEQQFLAARNEESIRNLLLISVRQREKQ